jgi:hypothetical protein
MPFLTSILLTAFVVLFLGCKSSEPQFKAAVGKSLKARNATAVVSEQSTPATNKPSIRLADAINGRVLAVRSPLRFVIVDFSASKMPKLDQRLSVYRLDQKVAELKVSGPYLGTTVAADVTAGDALEGDLVRDR